MEVGGGLIWLGFFGDFGFGLLFFNRKYKMMQLKASSASSIDFARCGGGWAERVKD